MKIIGIFCFVFLTSITCNAQIITTYAGNGVVGYSGDGGPATNAPLAAPSNVNFDNYGNLLIGDELLVKKINPLTGTIYTIAGDTTSTAIGNGGPATNAYISSDGVCVDAGGNVYIGDGAHYEVRMVNILTDTITDYAGTGTGGFSGDNGPATAATFSVGSVGCIDTTRKYMYISDEFNYRVRRVDMTTGIITTVAGTGVNGYSGDGTPATNAQLSRPTATCTDLAGNLYIGDWDNARIRKVDIATGIISTVVGNGTKGYSGDGGPTNAMINIAHGICFDKCGNLYFSSGIVDSNDHVVRKVDAVTGIITTIAGNGTAGFSGDNGPATNASLNRPCGICFDSSGNLYIADLSNQRIRKVTQSGELNIPTISLSGITGAPVGALVTITATVTHTGSSYNINWYNNGTLFNTTTVPTVTYTKTAGTDNITATVIAPSAGCYDSTTSAIHTVVVSEGINTITATQLYIYPNPANDVLHIDGIGLSPALSKGEGDVTYRIMSIVGAVMQQGTLKEGSNNIPINLLPSGMYMVEVTGSDGERIITKIIKQ